MEVPSLLFMLLCPVGNWRPEGICSKKVLDYRSILLSRGAEYLHHHFHSIRVTYDFLFSFSLTATIQSRRLRVIKMIGQAKVKSMRVVKRIYASFDALMHWYTWVKLRKFGCNFHVKPLSRALMTDLLRVTQWIFCFKVYLSYLGNWKHWGLFYSPSEARSC